MLIENFYCGHDRDSEVQTPGVQELQQRWDGYYNRCICIVVPLVPKVYFIDVIKCNRHLKAETDRYIGTIPNIINMYILSASNTLLHCSGNWWSLCQNKEIRDENNLLSNKNLYWLYPYLFIFFYIYLYFLVCIYINLYKVVTYL